MSDNIENLIVGIEGEKRKILETLKKLLDGNKLGEKIITESLGDFKIYIESADFDGVRANENNIKYFCMIPKEAIKFLGEKNLLQDLKIISIAKKNFRNEYDSPIKIKDLENNIELKKLKNDLSYIGEVEKIIITTPTNIKIREKVVKVLQKLTGGNLSSVSVGKITTEKTKDEKYIFSIEYVLEKAYLYDLRLLKNQGVDVFYQSGSEGTSYIEIGYQILDDVILKSFLSTGNSIYLKSSQKPLEEIQDFSKDDLTPIFDMIDIKIRNDKDLPIKSLFHEVNSDEGIINVEVSLNVKRSLYDKGSENLNSKIDTYRRDLEILEEIRDLENDRNLASQIVVIDFNHKEEVGRILSLFPYSLIDNVKILTFQLGSENHEKFYILYIKEFRVTKNPNIVKVYNCEKSFSHYNLKVFVEEGRYIYPFFALDKLKDSSVNNEIEEEAYYKMFLTSDDPEDAKSLSEIKQKKTIAILDNSKRIFVKRNLIFFNGSDFKENSIEVYNKSLLTHWDTFENVRKKHQELYKKHTLELKDLENSMVKTFEAGKGLLDKGYDVFNSNWNEVTKELNRYNKEIIKTKENKLPKLEVLFENLVNIEDVEEIKEVFKKFYSKITTEGIRLILEENQFKGEEKKLYEVWRNDWKTLKEENTLLIKNYNLLNKNMEDFSNESEEKRKKSIKKSMEILEKLNNSTSKIEIELKEILKTYE